MPYYNRDPKRDHNFDNHPYKEIIIKNPKKVGYAGLRLGLQAGFRDPKSRTLQLPRKRVPNRAPLSVPIKGSIRDL